MKIRYSLGFSLLISMLLLGLTSVQAERLYQEETPPAVTAEVVIAALNLRAGPGLDYPIVGVASQGDTFAVQGTDASRYWLQVNLPEGGTAWLSGGASFSSVSGPRESLPVVTEAASPSMAVTPVGSLAPAPTATMQAATGETVGGKLAFMNYSGGDIYLINADGSALRLLVQGGLDPALSPDGQWVAFTRWGMDEGVYVINVDGTGERLVHAAHQPKSPTWSADGTELVFNLQHGGRMENVKECIISSSPDDPGLPPDAYDTNRKTIEEDEEYEYCYWLPARPSWSLRRVDMATEEWSDLSSDYTSFGPAWDPREPWRIVYSGDATLVQLDMNRSVRMTLVEGTRDHTPSFSPSGRFLAVAYKEPEGAWRLDRFNMDTAERTVLAAEGNNVAPTWAPDGSQIAFLTNRTGAWNIWVMNMDGSNQRPMFAEGTLADIQFQYDGVDERMLSWGP